MAFTRPTAVITAIILGCAALAGCEKKETVIEETVAPAAAPTPPAADVNVTVLPSEAPAAPPPMDPAMPAPADPAPK